MLNRRRLIQGGGAIAAVALIGQPALAQTPETDTPPIAESNGVEVLYAYMAWGKVPEMLGEIRNPSDAPIGVQAAGVAIDLIDSEKVLIETIYGQPVSTLIGPGKTMPFTSSWINSEIKPTEGEWSREEISIELWTPENPVLWNALELSDIKQGTMTALETHVKGKITNTSGQESGSVHVAAAAYDADGRLVGITYSNHIRDLKPQETARFVIDRVWDEPWPGLLNSSDQDNYTIELIPYSYW